MAAKLSSQRNRGMNGNSPNPSGYYKTRLDRAYELLCEAANDDREYNSDMLMEGMREGVMCCVLSNLKQLIGLAKAGDAGRQLDDLTTP